MDLKGKLYDSVLDLWEKGKSKTQILDLLGRGLNEDHIKAIVSRARRIGDMRARRHQKKGVVVKHPNRYKIWSEEELKLAYQMRHEGGLSDAEIAQALGRTVCMVEEKLRFYRNGERIARRPPDRFHIPESVLENWNRRSAAPRRDLTAAVFGDPPIGFSALERRTGTPSALLVTN